MKDVYKRQIEDLQNVSTGDLMEASNQALQDLSLIHIQMCIRDRGYGMQFFTQSLLFAMQDLT